MHTLGFNFKPWTAAKSIADGPLSRVTYKKPSLNAASPNTIQHEHKVRSAEWSSDSSTWTVTTDHGGKTEQFCCNFLMMCSGYYNYDTPYTPDFQGQENFPRHRNPPQHWPKDLDYKGKKLW
ncbi:MAG: hypothetical protein CM15mP120_24410 [Pseudomonadota bacterium]|nr:MAG: hypothetical protein CM15mP120_24410 [Pseudomonadota bacterium]